MDDENTPDTHELRNGSQVVVRRAQLDDVKAIHSHLIELDVRSRALVFGHARIRNRGYVRKMVESGMLIASDLNGNVIGHAAYEADPFDDREFRDSAGIEMSVAVRWR